MKFGKIESMLEKIEFYEAEAMSIEMKNDQEYFGIFIDEKLSNKDKEDLLKQFNDIEIWELRYNDDYYNSGMLIESIWKHISINYYGAFILDKGELNIKEETDINDYSYINDITEWDD